MLRELQTIISTPANTMFSAGADLVTGMGVVKNESAKTVGVPSAETATGIYVVDKERVAQGVYSSVTDLPDSHDQFVKIKTGEMVKIKAYLAGERFATDQFVSTGLTVDNYVSVGTAGKWIKATSTVPSNFVYKGTVTDNGATLAIVEVVAIAGKNA